MIPIIKLFLFILSTIGSWEILRRNSKVNIYFLPSLTIAIQITLLFLAGLLNLLPEMTWFLYIVGLVGFAHSIYILTRKTVL
jgi:hypothetical protein